jgi:long-subunit acyl-CoA synthetase (AMP-forming)
MCDCTNAIICCDFNYTVLCMKLFLRIYFLIFSKNRFESSVPTETRTIVLTSGTNGKSKGLRLDDGWFNNFIKNSWTYSPLVVILGFMPFSHQTGRMMVCVCVFVC